MNLKAIRAAKGYADQAAFGAAIGVDQSTAQRMEAGKPSVSLRRYLDAAKLLDVSLAEIFADERTEAEMWLVRHWRSLAKDQQDLWAEHLRLAAGGRPPEGDAGNPQTENP